MIDQAQNLRNNVIKLQSQRNIKNARVITITSGKGGVGKSNTAVNLASCFIRQGKRVIIFDADFGLANVEVMLGTVPKHNLSDVLFGGMQIADVVTQGPGGIGFVSGGSGVTKLNDLSSTQLRRVSTSLSQLEDLCDILIVDTGAGVSASVMDFVLASPEIILVTTPEPSSITDSYALLKTLYKNPDYALTQGRVYLLANKVNSEIEGRAVYDKMSQVVGKFLGGSVNYLGMIPNDPVLEKCTRSQRVVIQQSPTAKSSKAFMDISEKLIQSEKNDKNKTGISRFFNSFLKRM